MSYSQISIGRKKKMLKQKQSIKKVTALVLSLFLGAVLALCRIMSFPAPFAAVLPAIIPTPFGIAALIGTMIGGAFGLSAEAIPLIAASGAALLSKIKVKGSSKRANLTASVFSSATYMMCSIALSAFSGGGISDLLRSLAFSAILLAVTYIFSKSSAELRSAKELPNAQVLFCCGAMVCALSSLNIGPISLGGIAAAYFVLFAAVRFGAANSASVAIACAIGAGVCSPAIFGDFAILGIPAVICGFLFFGSPIKSSGMLVLTFAPLAVLFSGSDSSIALLLDCAIASMAFVLTYRPAVRLSAEAFMREASPLKTNRTDLLRSAVNDISERLSGLADKPSHASPLLSDIVYSKVCLGCQKSTVCFEDKGAQHTLPELDKPDFSPQLTDICRILPYCNRVSDVRRVSLEAVRRREYLAEKSSERQNAIYLCSQMLSALDGVIYDAERIVQRSVSEDKLLTLKLGQMLKKAGVRFQSCAVWHSGAAEITLPSSARINEIKIAAAAAEITGADYAPPERSDVGESVLLRFEPKAEYSVEIGACQLPAGKDASGDVAETFVSGNYSYAILSDGMGVGSSARAVSLMLVSLLKEFICAGFSVETAIRLSSLILRSYTPEESFATVDLLRVNRATGAAEFYKAGACVSYLLADGAESVIKAGGYPVGILGSCDLKVHRFFVRDFAAIVMITDGAVAIDSAACSKTVGSGFRLPSSELAAMLLQGTSPEKSARKDDISVAVVKIERMSA